MNFSKYTPEEVEKNISELTKREEILKDQRTVITKDINSVKKQIKYWEELDQSQIKMF